MEENMHKFTIEINRTAYYVKCDIKDEVCNYVREKGEIAYKIDGIRVHIMVALSPDIYKIGNDVYIYICNPTNSSNSLYCDRITKNAVESAIPYAVKAFKLIVKEVDTNKKYTIEF